MDWQKVLFDPNGRIGQNDYWIGVAILIGANVVAGWIPVIGFLISLGLIYVGVCVYGKRLHDTGRTAWLHVLPWGIGLALGFIGMLAAGGAVMTAMMQGDEVNPAAMIAAGGAFMLCMGLAMLVWLGYTIWLGLQAGEAGENRFGLAPGAPVQEPSVIESRQTPPPGDDTPPAL